MSTRHSDSSNGRARPASAQTASATLHQRGIEATRHLREALSLPTSVGDAAVLGTILAEVAAEESRRNPTFANEVRRRYEAAIATRRPAARDSRQVQVLPPLVPIRRIEGAHHRDPFAPPDPTYLVQLYGKHQLARALQGFLVDSLKQTAAQIEQQHPGTKPTNRGRKDALIAYIIEYSAKE
jgi:hypothetical protein